MWALGEESLFLDFRLRREEVSDRICYCEESVKSVLMVLREVGRAKLFPRELVPGGLYYCRAKGGFVKLKLYTVWNYKYDIHCTMQVLGRGFLVHVKLIDIPFNYSPGFLAHPL